MKVGSGTDIWIRAAGAFLYVTRIEAGLVDKLLGVRASNGLESSPRNRPTVFKAWTEELA